MFTSLRWDCLVPLLLQPTLPAASRRARGAGCGAATGTVLQSGSWREQGCGNDRKETWVFFFLFVFLQRLVLGLSTVL